MTDEGRDRDEGFEEEDLHGLLDGDVIAVLRQQRSGQRNVTGRLVITVGTFPHTTILIKLLQYHWLIFMFFPAISLFYENDDRRHFSVEVFSFFDISMFYARRTHFLIR